MLDEVRNSSQILVSIDDHLYGMPTVMIREMLACPTVTEVPRLPDHVRGLLNLRGEVIPLLDLRRRLGLRSRLDDVADMIQMLHDREQDHCRWVETVTLCVREGRELAVQTDPHLCAFGRWYYGFQTDNRLLAMALKHFEKPHADIHAAAVTIGALLLEGDRDGVEAALVNLQKDLAEMRRLFADVREKVSASFQEIAVVISVNGGRAFAVTVDRVESVEPVRDEEPPPQIAGTRLDSVGLLRGIARRAKDGVTVLLLDPAVIGESIAEAAV